MCGATCSAHGGEHGGHGAGRPAAAGALTFISVVVVAPDLNTEDMSRMLARAQRMLHISPYASTQLGHGTAAAGGLGAG
jgi:hypothetical protein